jgi:hypothetical protein
MGFSSNKKINVNIYLEMDFESRKIRVRIHDFFVGIVILWLDHRIQRLPLITGSWDQVPG